MKDDNTIEPTSDGIPKDPGFQVPEGYFEGFEDRTFKALKDGEARLPAGNPFTVPQGYFDGMEDAVMSKVRPGARMVPLKQTSGIRVWLAAASVALVAGIGITLYVNNRKPAVPVSPIQLADVPAEEIQAYAADVEISDDDILALVSEQTLDSLNKTYAVSTTVNNKIPASIDEETTLIQDEFTIEADDEQNMDI